jgi:hypothetical protein
MKKSEECWAKSEAATGTEAAMWAIASGLFSLTERERFASVDELRAAASKAREGIRDFVQDAFKRHPPAGGAPPTSH